MCAVLVQHWDALITAVTGSGLVDLDGSLAGGWPGWCCCKMRLEWDALTGAVTGSVLVVLVP